MFKTRFEFWTLVIWTCLGFVILYFGFNFIIL